MKLLVKKIKPFDAIARRKRNVWEVRELGRKIKAFAIDSMFGAEFKKVIYLRCSYWR